MVQLRLSLWRCWGLAFFTRVHFPHQVRSPTSTPSSSSSFHFSSCGHPQQQQFHHQRGGREKKEPDPPPLHNQQGRLCCVFWLWVIGGGTRRGGRGGGGGGGGEEEEKEEEEEEPQMEMKDELCYVVGDFVTRWKTSTPVWDATESCSKINPCLPAATPFFGVEGWVC